MCANIQRCTTGTHTNVYVPYTIQIISWTVSPSDCKCAHMCVPLPLTRIFHFITSLVCDDRDKTVVTEMSERGGRKKGVWNWTGNYVLQLRHGGDIKSYTPVPGDKMQEGGRCNGRRQFNQNPGLTRRAGGWRKAATGDRTAMFNNVLGISVEECTSVCKICDVIQLQNKPKT